MPANVFDTGDFLQAAVARLLAFVSLRGDSIADVCPNDRVYIGRAPDNAEMPYGVISEMDGETDPDLDNNRREVILGWLGVSADPQESELLADLGEAALLSWRNSSEVSGLIYGMRTEGRRKIDPAEDPAKRDRYESSVNVRICAWIPPLTQLATT